MKREKDKKRAKNLNNAKKSEIANFIQQFGANFGRDRIVKHFGITVDQARYIKENIDTFREIIRLRYLPNDEK